MKNNAMYLCIIYIYINITQNKDYKNAKPTFNNGVTFLISLQFCFSVDFHLLTKRDHMKFNRNTNEHLIISNLLLKNFTHKENHRFYLHILGLL